MLVSCRKNPKKIKNNNHDSYSYLLVQLVVVHMSDICQIYDCILSNHYPIHVILVMHAISLSRMRQF